ncbi:PKD domain-containing protein [Ohtaekwangia sp.]|uniref:PKD domain-containing protein n=1 Tax=Ohtaekwangia sp. TaxID=2066019 RepID=UPI002FDD0353
MIKKFIASMAPLCMCMFFSCSKDDHTTLTPDFTLSVSGTSPNAIVTITNTSTGGSSYAWVFDEGANVSMSTDKTPAPLTVDKADAFDVTLTVTNGHDVKSITKTINVTGNNAIVSYTNIAFGKDANSPTYGRFFSTETGLIYKASEVNSTSGPKIDLAYSHIRESVNYFASPDDLREKYNIPGAKTTTIINSPGKKLGVTANIFDNAKDDSFIKNVQLNTSDNESFESSNPSIILFRTASGKKGAIKTTAINGDRLLVDIKVQKY